MQYKYIDTHCHLFHKGFLSRRIFKELIELSANLEIFLRRPKHSTKENSQHVSIKSAIIRLKNFISLTMSDSGEKVLSELEKGYGNDQFIYVPLSYDLISCFQEEYIQDIGKLSKTKESSSWKSIKKSYQEIITKYLHFLTKYNFLKDFLELYFHLERIEEHEQQHTTDTINLEKNIYFKQLNELIKLKEKYPEKIFPFFYYDPRRPGLFDILKQYVGKDNYFLGVKLYTPNGYSPLDPNLMNVYAFCEENNIPITAHCSSGGFSTFTRDLEIKGKIYLEKERITTDINGFFHFEHNFFVTPTLAIAERASILNHPLLWEEVLEIFPNLKLNLAHFGGDSLLWQQEIFRLIYSGKYPNLYTDLSCTTEKDMLQYIKKKYFDTKFADKFLYGSDFYLNMFFIDNFKKYYKNFRQVFTNNEFSILAKVNPEKFLFDK